jgi:hypothetical protein
MTFLCLVHDQGDDLNVSVVSNLDQSRSSRAIPPADVEDNEVVEFHALDADREFVPEVMRMTMASRYGDRLKEGRVICLPECRQERMVETIGSRGDRSVDDDKYHFDLLCPGHTGPSNRLIVVDPALFQSKILLDRVESFVAVARKPSDLGRSE